MNHLKQISLAMLALLMTTINVSAQQPMRISAEAEYRWGGIDVYHFQRVDTFDYYYKPSRTYDAARKKWFHDSKIGWGFEYPDYVTALRFNVDTSIFDAKGNVVCKVLTHLWNGNWDTVSLTKRAFDASDRLVSETKDEIMNNVWERVYRYKATYDAQGNISDAVTEKYNYLWLCLEGDSVINTYTGNELTSRINYNYFCNSTNYILTKYTYKYNSANLDTVWQEKYDQPSGPYQPYRMQVLHYNSLNDVDTLKIFYWDQFVAMNWAPLTREIYLSDNNHNQLSRTYQKWNNVQWINEKKDSTEYYPINVPHIFYEELVWDVDSNAFVFDESMLSSGTIKFVYYYGFPTAIDKTPDRNDLNLKVFPNPANNSIKIRFAGINESLINVTIYNSVGQAVKHWVDPGVFNYERTADVSDLPTGQYFIKINSGREGFAHFSILH